MSHSERGGKIKLEVASATLREGVPSHQRVSPLPKSSIISVRKRRDKLRNMDGAHAPAVTSSKVASVFRPDIQPSSTTAAPPFALHENAHRRTASARPASPSNRAGNPPPRQSSLKHRMLNRLASGLLPIQSVLELGTQSLLQEEPRIFADRQRVEQSQAVIDVHQADPSSTGTAFFAIDVGCSNQASGEFPLDIAFLVDNS